MKTKLKALGVLSLFCLLTFSLSLVALARTAKENDGLHPNNEDSLTPNGVGLLMTTIGVSTTIDGLNDGDGLCSLREAIEAANADIAVDACPAGSGHDIINVPAGTYLLTIADTAGASSGDLDITSTLTISGAGAGLTTIDDNAGVRIFDIKNTGVATITGVTVVGGDGSRGGGVRNQGTLLLLDSAITDNEATSDGGGIYNDGNNADLTVTNSIINLNRARDGAGGGIYNRNGMVTINNSRIIRNTSETTSTAGFGGGIVNFAEGSDATMTINQSTISTNTVNGVGGGGLLNQDGIMTVVNSTISGNTANDSGPVSGLGGGLVNTSIGSAARVWFTNTTVTNNTAVVGSGVANAEGPSFDAIINFKNSIIGDGCANPNPAGTLTSNGYNMENGNTCNFTDPTDFTNTNPMLGPLQKQQPSDDTETHALPANSPAIDAGTCSGAPSNDQRGQNRPHAISDFCDIGAIESSSLGTADLEITKSVTPPQADPGQAITYILTFVNNGPAWAGDVVIDDEIPLTVTGLAVTNNGVPITATAGVTYNWTLGDLARGGSGTIKITGIISPSVLTGSSFINTALIDNVNDSDSDSATVSIGGGDTTVYLPIILK